MAVRALAGCVAVLLAVSGCVGIPPDREVPARLVGAVTVLAPASLTEAFTTLAAEFGKAQPGLEVRPTFGADSEHAKRASSGADILVVEGPEPLTGLGTGAPVVFARNQLVIAVSQGNPKTVNGVTDLARPDLKIVLCAETEPCGGSSAAVLAAAGVSVAGAIRVPDVRAALARVEQGTADVALVYRTDTRVAGDRVDTVEFGQSRAALAAYQGVALASAPNPNGARAFLDFLASAPARDLLTAAGFQPP